MMPYDTNKLPSPPDFPASNASYNSIVGKMHKAALCATTASAAIAAVTSIKNHIGGVNTYAKATRRYADTLIEALSAAQPTEVEKAAAEGQPIADFMLTGAKAQKAVDTITQGHAAVTAGAKAAAAKVTKATGVKVTVNEGETFSDKSNARRALKRKGLDHLPMMFEDAGNGRVRPVVTVSDDKGIAYAAERGIKAKVTA